jgi:hypothetical protein
MVQQNVWKVVALSLSNRNAECFIAHEVHEKQRMKSTSAFDAP